MNNSRILLEPTIAANHFEETLDRTIELTEKEARLVRILEAIQEVQKNEAWCTLKSEVFDDLTSKLERELRDEAKRDDPNTNKLNRIAGQLKWAERFSDLSKLEKKFRVELQGIRLQSR